MDIQKLQLKYMVLLYTILMSIILDIIIYIFHILRYLLKLKEFINTDSILTPTVNLLET